MSFLMFCKRALYNPHYFPVPIWLFQESELLTQICALSSQVLRYPARFPEKVLYDSLEMIYCFCTYKIMVILMYQITSLEASVSPVTQLHHSH